MALLHHRAWHDLLHPGIYGANVGNATLTAFTIPGALLTLASMLIFAWTVWRAAQHKG